MNITDISKEEEEIFYLRERLGDLVKCVPIEEFSPLGENNTNYNLFISDIIQCLSVIVIQNINPAKIQVVIFSEDDTPRILLFDKEKEN
jgi:hypothetical protein